MNRAPLILSFILCMIIIGCGPRLNVRHPVAPGDTYYTWVTWCGDDFKGKTMANGEPYDPQQFTGAADGFPFGTMLEVSDLDSGKLVVVRVTDRPGKNVVDLTPQAFKTLSPEQAGRLRGKITVVGLPGENSLLRRNEAAAPEQFFTVQFGAYSTLENARAFIETLGIAEAYIYLEQGDRTLYRVRVGRFADRASAEKFIGERAKGHEAIIIEVSE